MVLYHITPLSNMDSILQNGLQPQIGERSLSAGETDPAVYLFASRDDLEQALLTWAGDEFEEEEIALLGIHLPPKFHQSLQRNEYEIVCRESIPPQYVQLITEKYLN